MAESTNPANNQGRSETMSTFLLAAFFALFSLMNLIPDIKIPTWVLGVLAAAVCLALVIGAIRKEPRP